MASAVLPRGQATYGWRYDHATSSSTHRADDAPACDCDGTVGGEIAPDCGGVTSAVGRYASAACMAVVLAVSARRATIRFRSRWAGVGVVCGYFALVSGGQMLARRWRPQTAGTSGSHGSRRVDRGNADVRTG